MPIRVRRGARPPPASATSSRLEPPIVLFRFAVGGIYHVPRETSLEAKKTDESRNGLGGRWVVVANGRRIRRKC
jgi:hypothetical protein